jgi:hypothetical protein
MNSEFLSIVCAGLLCTGAAPAAAETGPRLSDAEFFGLMVPDRSEMAAAQCP